MPPIPIGKMYSNYTATVSEAVEVAVRGGLDSSTVLAREDEIVNGRINIIATALNINASAFSGSIVHDAGTRRRLLSVGWRRRLNDLNTSACDSSIFVYMMTLIHESVDASERDRVVEFVDANGGSFGPVINATGEGDDAVVCVAAAVTSIDREIVDAPPPPPLGLALQTSDPLPISTILIVGTVVAGFACLCCGLWFAYCCATRNPKSRDEKKKLLITTTPDPPSTTDFAWQPVRF